ncbi:hypothetical protein CEE37_03800 [candidate division LCP-89 bacterium B3_LCP]|uniref:Ribosome maturation factor RimP n=1 Tax=candidate division LCP-89 bacterium B3_LCP TaxID=2012998 RepID=A0A532V3A3_UNCL8|nr:MAG: hypothetical protein CEE37_03800 [candidate division LCP-89 bacterium B3_LCP]
MDSIELERRIGKLVESAGFHLISANWHPVRGRQHLRVLSDAEDHNISVEECADLSHQISDLLDSYPHDFPDYRLEVSSPGLNHPLKKWQFEKNVGRSVEVRYQEEGKQVVFKGELTKVMKDSFAVNFGEHIREFAFDIDNSVFVIPSLK